MTDPHLVTTKLALRSLVAERRMAGGSPGRPVDVGLVPTMGSLHEGHLSLARRARAENGLVVMSLFVNPTQFGAGEDFDRYPRDLDRDLHLAGDVGVDAVFQPLPGEMYDPGHCTWVDVEGFADHLCGASRPGHFRGVATVVTKLFGLCRPERAYFGQKDVQQALLIRRMATDLDLGVDVVVCPIVREPDGLAMSSRNVYLTPAERGQAPMLHRALREAEAAIAAGERDTGVVRATVLEVLAEASFGWVDYVEVVNADDLQPVDVIVGEVVVAVAVRFGATRLIDNVIVKA
jgi:pantoate--beta-alanine ligase